MAGLIPSQFIDELLTRVDIVDVIDVRVPLKKAGKNLQACCPFHSEKTPSFTVSPDKQFYHCFGCGAHGTAVGFLMEFDQLSFPEAIQELADSVGMQVPVNQQAPQMPGRQNLYDLLDKVSQYYVHQLHNHPQKQQFQDYIRTRGLSAEIVQRYGIGMAPPGWDNVLKTFGGQQHSQEQLLEGGLVIRNDQGRVYDRFRKRLMFPIHDRRGRVIAFGGRVIDPEDAPKYLNSPETPVFHKGRELYGLYQARKANRRMHRVLIVEGYMDVIALAQQGITNAVATLGTATTPDHLRLLTRAAPEVVFCFDGDRAGQEAAWRAAENALPVLGGNFELKFMFLPEGEDPDTLVNKIGAEAFSAEIDQAQSYSEFFFDTLSKRVDTKSMDGRARLVELAKPYLRHVPAGMFRDMLEQRLSEVAKTPLQTLNKHLDKRAANQAPKRSGQKISANMTPVRLAVTILVQYPQLRRHVSDTEPLKSLDAPGADILCELLETLAEHPNLHTGAILERWRDNKHGKHLERLALQPLSLSEEALKHELDGSIQALNKQALKARHAHLSSKPFNELSETEKLELQSLK